MSLVGAGGKTSTMFRLAHELASARLRVITTTTTRIGRPTDEQTGAFVVESDRARLLEAASQALASHRHVTVACASYEQNKFQGVPPEWIADLRDLPHVHAVIVEADGARKLPFKAPRDGEPVIPAETTLLVACAGMVAVGAPFAEEYVCRAELAAKLAGAQPGEAVTPAHIARVLMHPEGGLKNRPPAARAVALLNQADEPARWAAARETAAVLHDSGAFDEILIGTLAEGDPIIERWGRVAVIVMAAGEGRRFGDTVKQLAPWNGRALIRHIVELVERSRADEIQVVLGARAEQIRPALDPLGPRTRVTQNTQWHAGMSTSVIAGLKSSRVRPSAAVFVNVDQPGIAPDLIDRLIDRHRRTGAQIVAPRYQNMRGNPVLWDRSMFGELETLSGDVGGREILRQHWREIVWVELGSEEELTDTDTPEEYQRLKEILGA